MKVVVLLLLFLLLRLSHIIFVALPVFYMIRTISSLGVSTASTCMSLGKRYSTAMGFRCCFVLGFCFVCSEMFTELANELISDEGKSFRHHG